MKILILKPSSLGDVIQALPVLRLLKRHWPDSEIFWWIDSALAPLLEGDPDLAGVVRFERKRWRSPWHWPEMLRSIRRLRAAEFDLVVDLQCLAHAVDWYLSVLPPLDVPLHKSFVWLPERPKIADAVKHKWPGVFVSNSKSEIQNPKLIALLPGARWHNKRWPIEHFAEIARQIAKEFPAASIAICVPWPAVSPIAGHCLNLCGQTSLPEMIEWLRRCDLVITNDTGPMHAAAALGRPLVALFGPTEPRRTGPYGQLENVLHLDFPCAPCLKARCHFPMPEECLRALSPAQVLAHAHKLLA